MEREASLRRKSVFPVAKIRLESEARSLRPEALLDRHRWTPAPREVSLRRMSRANDPTSPGALFRSLPRAWDDLPIWAQLNITWKCNLDCVYCTEYDNSKGHVPYEDLVRRIDKCKELGTLHTDLIGGEPMLHPDLKRLMAYVTSLGMTTGMTTNG